MFAEIKDIDEKVENNTAPIAAKLASEGKVKTIVKGHIHTDILLKALLKRDLNFRELKYKGLAMLHKDNHYSLSNLLYNNRGMGRNFLGFHEC